YFPARFFAPSGPVNRRISVAGKKKGRTMNPLTQSKNTTILPVLVALAFACFALVPQARAVCQEGCLSSNNTALGEDALISNTTGFDNTAIGLDALFSNTTGSANTATGWTALQSNTTGSDNIALGVSAGINLTTGNFNIDISNAGVAGESRTIRIGTRGTHGNTSIAGISGVTVPNGVGVIIDTNGHLGTVVSSARY